MTLCVREFVSCEHHKESVVSGEIIYETTRLILWFCGLHTRLDCSLILP